MGMRWRLIIDFFKPKLGWDSREKVEKEITKLRDKILKSNGND